MVQYTLTLKLDNAILTSGATDKLVIAKKVNGVLSTVFAGASPVPANGFKQLQSSNVFQWEDKYKVFGTATFGKGIMVRPPAQKHSAILESHPLWRFLI
jgi:hypothetical protein